MSRRTRVRRRQDPLGRGGADKSELDQRRRCSRMESYWAGRRRSDYSCGGGACVIISTGRTLTRKRTDDFFACPPLDFCRPGCNPTQGCIFVSLPPRHNCAADMTRWGWESNGGPGEKRAARVARVRDWIASPRLFAPCSAGDVPRAPYPQHPRRRMGFPCAHAQKRK